MAKKEELKVFDVDKDYWTRVALKLSKVREWEDDREKAWRKPFYGAFFFGIGFFILLTGAELFPMFIGPFLLILLSVIGALGMGMGLYWMCT